MTLIADSSGAITNGFKTTFDFLDFRIMCWAHMIRNVDKHLKLITIIKLRPLVRNDIVSIQQSLNEQIFNSAVALFFEKWSAHGESVAEFLNYLKQEWIERNNGWYEGFALEISSTNNALESFNRSVKQHHTFGCRMAVGQFLEFLKIQIVKSWSTDRDPAQLNC